MKKFTLELNAAENIVYIGKYFKQKLHRIKCPTKDSVGAYSIYFWSNVTRVQLRADFLLI